MQAKLDLDERFFLNQIFCVVFAEDLRKKKS